MTDAADAGGRLTPDGQAAALAEWGRRGSFRCCLCGQESTETAPHAMRTSVGFGMAACRPCTRRMGASPTFRRKARRLADAAAVRTLLQRVADLAGITGPALLRALPLAGIDKADALLRADIALRLPPGTLASAFAQVLQATRPH